MITLARPRPGESDADRGPDDSMIEQAWNEYRGWAKRAGSLQAKAGRWNLSAMIALVATAEDLMESERVAWIDQMAKTIRPAPSPPP